MSTATGARATDGRATQAAEQALDRLARTARPDVVFGQPIERGEATIIPCCEIALGMGMGSGSGASPTPTRRGEQISEVSATGTSSGEGAGAGGGARGRPVAVIVISRGAVHVEPVVDATRIALAALTTAGFMAFWVARLLGTTRAPLPQPPAPVRGRRALWRARMAQLPPVPLLPRR